MSSARPAASTRSTGPATGPGHPNPEEQIQSSFMGDQLPSNAPVDQDITPSSKSREDGAKVCEQEEEVRGSPVVLGPRDLLSSLHSSCTGCQLIRGGKSSQELGQLRNRTSSDLSSATESDDESPLESRQEYREQIEGTIGSPLDQDESGLPGLRPDVMNHTPPRPANQKGTIAGLTRHSVDRKSTEREQCKSLTPPPSRSLRGP